ncbi:class I SAM-dependent methyltransferase [Lentzea sp. NBRC 105346]|uniref:SAM-dependent methyltransferase n=1 Tax=Lentzea sp. NBRC 105346 TaxID=3032205 RepID=UPI0025544BF9|nr:class I SAM-dependent methyltransferase [Lentzea sp. NBRC 105346]
MTKLTPLHEDLTFHGPLSEERAARLIRSLGSLKDAHVVDVGCGWAELLLRILEADPSATGHGVDRDAEAIAHGRENARARGLADRVELEVADVAAWSGGPADVLIVNGASQVWGGAETEHTANALRAGRALLRPGGRLLLGEGFWEREPTDEQLAAMPIPRDQYRDLPGLVDLAMAHGYRLLSLSQASLDEWDEFESQHSLAWEHWLLANPDSPEADKIRAKADTFRGYRLRGWRGTLGMAYLTLVVSHT